SLIGLRPRRSIAGLIDYWGPAMLLRFNSLARRIEARTPPVRPRSAEIQGMTVRRLQRALQRLAPGTAESDWVRYGAVGPLAEKKQRFFRDVLDQDDRIRTLLDVGCNTGTASRQAAERGIQVVAVDQDMACVDRLYREIRDTGLPLLRLWVDIANPS